MASHWSCIYTLRCSCTKFNLLGCPKLTTRFQPLVGGSSPYCEDMWGRHCCLTSFFPIVDTCLSCEDVVWQSCAMVPRWRIFSNFLGPAFAASCVQHTADLHSKFAPRSHHVWKYGRHPMCNVNLECMYEMCCTRLAQNTGRKKLPKIRDLGTIA